MANASSFVTTPSRLMSRPVCVCACVCAYVCMCACARIQTFPQIDDVSEEVVIVRFPARLSKLLSHAVHAQLQRLGFLLLVFVCIFAFLFAFLFLFLFFF